MYKKHLSVLFLLPIIILFSCQGNQMEQKHKAAYVAINKILDGGNVDELDAYIAPDAVDHQLDPSITNKTGLAGIKEVFKYYHSIFPDMKTTIHSMAVSGDTLFGYCTSVGTASQPFMGMPAGEQMTLNAVDVVVFEGDMMKEHWGFMDMSDVMAMMQQSQMMGEVEGMEQEMGR
jgi:predicted ester cyclase